eukprot:TRINITY_DN609_c0_g1_i2.p1 TRINITY_DN609_c0_g1~~TRINITY_DN609_c0_g1_i2.p1  ORF type:complete len:163 (-),score=13.69 TRINITY_DN609_c0_g1_i2:314-802(-)
MTFSVQDSEQVSEEYKENVPRTVSFTESVPYQEKYTEKVPYVEEYTVQVPFQVAYTIQIPYKKNARGIAGAWKKVTRYRQETRYRAEMRNENRTRMKERTDTKYRTAYKMSIDQKQSTTLRIESEQSQRMLHVFVLITLRWLRSYAQMFQFQPKESILLLIK